MCQLTHSDHVISEHTQGERQICSSISASDTSMKKGNYLNHTVLKLSQALTNTTQGKLVPADFSNTAAHQEAEQRG